MVTFRYHTTQTLNFVEKAAAQIVDKDYQLLIKLFSNLRISGPNSSPINPSIPGPSSFKSSNYLGDNQAIKFPVSGRHILQARRKNTRLYRQVQMKDRTGSIPLKTFTLFSKLPPELRVKIWQCSFVGRVIVSKIYCATPGGHERCKNYVLTSNPVQLLINAESRAEVKRQYKFWPNEFANWRYRSEYRSKKATSLFDPHWDSFLPNFGIYYHSEIDALSMTLDEQPLNVIYQHIYQIIRTSVFCRSCRYGWRSDPFQYIQSLVISEASWTTFDLRNAMQRQRRSRFGYAAFHHLRQVVICSSGMVINGSNNLLYTKPGRKQCLDFLKWKFKQAQEANPAIKIRVPVFRIYCKATSTYYVD